MKPPWLQNPSARARKHNTYSPSTARRWMRCPGSARLIEHLLEEGEIQDKPPRAAEVGTAWHEVMKKCLASDMSIDEALEAVCSGRPDMEEDMWEDDLMLQPLIDKVKQWERIGYRKWVEKQVSLTTPGGENLGGTANVILWNNDKRILRVVALKTGRWGVDPVGNEQLALYAYMAAADVCPSKTENFAVIMCIYQPSRQIVWNEWESDMNEIKTIWLRAEKAADTPLSSESLVPGHVQCQWCPAQKHCPAYSEWESSHCANDTR